MYREGERPGKRETESYFNKLVHAALAVGMTEICRAGQQAGDPGGDGIARVSWDHLEQNSFFLGGPQSYS